jgi:hypothetical protein
MQSRSVAIYREVLSGDDVDERVDLLAAQFVGVVFNRYIIKSGPVATMTAEQLSAHLAGIVRHILLE